MVLGTSDVFEMFNLRVSEPGVRLLHGYYRVKVALIDTSFGDIPYTVVT